MNVCKTYGDHFVLDLSVKSIYCTPEPNMTLYINYTSINF